MFYIRFFPFLLRLLVRSSSPACESISFFFIPFLSLTHTLIHSSLRSSSSLFIRLYVCLKSFVREWAVIFSPSPPSSAFGLRRCSVDAQHTSEKKKEKRATRPKIHHSPWPLARIEQVNEKKIVANASPSPYTLHTALDLTYTNT